jgi:ubiquinone/menaquinone biosynthesis C-methylase UbiE
MLDGAHTVLFMNYGFADLDPQAALVELSEEDEKNRYQVQLYHHLASSIVWTGLDALEVSSGRGGGAHFVKRHFHPRSLTGVDFAGRAVRFCNQHYATQGLTFVQDSAETLRFPDASFDVILNVEASFYYPDVERFFGQVTRLLRPDGYFLYADMRYAEELETWRQQLGRTGLDLLTSRDITPNVLKALALNRERMLEHRRIVPRILHGPFAEFSGITGAGLVPDSARRGDRSYWSYVFQKNQSGLGLGQAARQ